VGVNFGIPQRKRKEAGIRAEASNPQNQVKDTDPQKTLKDRRSRKTKVGEKIVEERKKVLGKKSNSKHNKKGRKEGISVEKPTRKTLVI